MNRFLSHSALPSLLARQFYSRNASSLRHIAKISDLSKQEANEVLSDASLIKAHPEKYTKTMLNKTLLMLFEKPSLRTRVSFEVGMEQLGGHAIYYSIDGSPLGKKENITDTAQCLSRYCDIIMARVTKRQDIAGLSSVASIPVINGLDDFAHPCQTLCDLLTIIEKKGSLDGKKIAYVGDIRNNVTYDLMRAACMMGMHISVSGPKGPDFNVEEEVIEECNELCKKDGSGSFLITNDAKEAVKNADIVYTDSWMSYHIPKDQMEHRKKVMMPYQVNAELMAHAKSDAIFMNCLPAIRGMEQTAEVIDGPQSIVFDQAENRLHAQKSLMLWLLK